jgi:hypothetical protein
MLMDIHLDVVTCNKLAAEYYTPVDGTNISIGERMASVCSLTV